MAGKCGLGLPVDWAWEIPARRRCPPGTPPGTLAPMFRVWGKRRLGGVSGADTRGSRKAWDHPDNSGSILFRTQCSGSRWAPGGHSVTSAHPGVEGKLFRATRPLLAKDGLVGAGTQFACEAVPAGGGEAFPEEYSELAAAGLARCRGPQVFRRWVGRHSQRIMGKEVSFHPEPASGSGVSGSFPFPWLQRHGPGGRPAWSEEVTPNRGRR